MIKPSRKPYGYRELLVYKKAEELQKLCSELTHIFPKTKTLLALADQMDRSARSAKQNIVEGWKRNSSKEYYDFLGFSMGANAELEEDCDDIWKGMYPDLLGIQGIMGERGEKGEMGVRGGVQEKGEMGKKWEEEKMDGKGEKGETRQRERIMGEKGLNIEALPFYPLDKSLPAVVQLKLRCKELNFLFDRLQKSLLAKMNEERTLPVRDRFQLRGEAKRQEELFETKLLREHGFVKLENGRVVSEKKKDV